MLATTPLDRRAMHVCTSITARCSVLLQLLFIVAATNITTITSNYATIATEITVTCLVTILALLLVHVYL